MQFQVSMLLIFDTSKFLDIHFFAKYHLHGTCMIFLYIAKNEICISIMYKCWRITFIEKTLYRYCMMTEFEQIAWRFEEDVPVRGQCVPSR